MEDKGVLQVWQKSIELKDGHYELDIPFKTLPPQLPDNKLMAERRLQYQKVKLEKDHELLEKYKEEIEGLIEAG